MEKINCHIIYILQLEDDCWYIGWTTTNAFKKRIKDHWAQAGKGSIWSTLHKPVRVYDMLTYDRSLTESQINRIEDTITLKYGRLYGFDKVRGGGYCQMMPVWPIEPPKLTKSQRKAKRKQNKELRTLNQAQREMALSNKLL